ncbi:hypothetical protein AQI70_08880 [Streptomyces curacoi]|uniref:Uncharacterized protein n=1 Tax=Streptomyces curacoi TaxID=146536 RepID=A0A117PGX9_9ACTN|nr:hypothetical protein AQI70_08880 [Streptomyces curacoi]
MRERAPGAPASDWDLFTTAPPTAACLSGELTAGAATPAAPAHAEIHVDLLGGTLYTAANGAIHVGADGADLLRLPNVLSPVV